jgi:hypothetical protein
MKEEKKKDQFLKIEKLPAKVLDFDDELLSSESKSEAALGDPTTKAKLQEFSNHQEGKIISKGAFRVWIEKNPEKANFYLEIFFPTIFIFIVTPAINLFLMEKDMVCLNIAYDLKFERNCENWGMNLLLVIFVAFQCDLGHFLFGFELLIKFCTDLSRRRILMLLQALVYWGFKFIFILKGVVVDFITLQMRVIASLSMYLVFYIGCLFFMKRKNTFSLARNYLMF